MLVNPVLLQGEAHRLASMPGRVVPDQIDPVAGKPLPEPFNEPGALPLVEPGRAHAHDFAERADDGGVEQDLFLPGEVESTVARPLGNQPFLGKAS